MKLHRWSLTPLYDLDAGRNDHTTHVESEEGSMAVNIKENHQHVGKASPFLVSTDVKSTSKRWATKRHIFIHVGGKIVAFTSLLFGYGYFNILVES